MPDDNVQHSSEYYGNRTTLVKGAVVSTLFMVSSIIGNDSISSTLIAASGGLATELGGDFLSNLIDRWGDDMFIEQDEIESDISNAIAKALRESITQVERNWLYTEHYRNLNRSTSGKQKIRESKVLLKLLKDECTTYLRSINLSVLEDISTHCGIGNNEEGQIAHSIIVDSLNTLTYGHDEILIEMLTNGILEYLPSRFRRIMRTDQKVWSAIQDFRSRKSLQQTSELLEKTESIREMVSEMRGLFELATSRYDQVELNSVVAGQFIKGDRLFPNDTSAVLQNIDTEHFIDLKAFGYYLDRIDFTTLDYRTALNVAKACIVTGYYNEALSCANHCLEMIREGEVLIMVSQIPFEFPSLEIISQVYIAKGQYEKATDIYLDMLKKANLSQNAQSFLLVARNLVKMYPLSLNVAGQCLYGLYGGITRSGEDINLSYIETLIDQQIKIQDKVYEVNPLLQEWFGVNSRFDSQYVVSGWQHNQVIGGLQDMIEHSSPVADSQGEFDFDDGLDSELRENNYEFSFKLGRMLIDYLEKHNYEDELRHMVAQHVGNLRLVKRFDEARFYLHKAIQLNQDDLINTTLATATLAALDFEQYGSSAEVHEGLRKALRQLEIVSTSVTDQKSLEVFMSTIGYIRQLGS
jgi:tetratricopeptide (TPR) repeat protein